MSTIADVVLKLLEPDILNRILGILVCFLYLTGRITREQFRVEQLKNVGLIEPRDAKKIAVEKTTEPVTAIFDLLDHIPILNTKFPVINASLPIILKLIIQTPIGVLSDVIHNIPVLGTNVRVTKS